jgi:formylglycine-generating enzyme required for sulfatase activity
MKIGFSKTGLFIYVPGLALWVVPLQVLAQTTIMCTATKQGEDKVLIMWNTVGGRTYALESKTTVIGPWETGAALTSTNGSLSLAVPIEGERQFFRVVERGLPPAPLGMVLISEGTFQMGDSLADSYIEELPVHTVTVSAFYMDRTEVTKALWDEVYAWALDNGYSFDSDGGGKGMDHPVHSVSWYDVVKWCNARSEREGRVPAYYTDAELTTVYKTDRVAPDVRWDRGYRLATEAEWEYAARGGLSERRFPWGNTISHIQGNYFSMSVYSYDVSPTRGYHPTYATGGEPYTSPVGSFGANEYGLCDMAGNVGEYCWDWYGQYYYSSSPLSNPRGPLGGSSRVIRGGGWWGAPAGCRVTSRLALWPDFSRNRYGFRAVLPPDQ